MWTVVPSNDSFDFLRDQQTGQYADDIVGTATNPGFMTRFDGQATPETTDDFIAYRVRLNQSSGTQYTGYAWVGVDANNDGGLDAFIRYGGGGGNFNVEIRAPGTGLNNSPSTTTISATAAISYDLTINSSYVNYRLATIGDKSTMLNVDPGDTQTDAYLSFQLPFMNLVNFLQTKNITITKDSVLRYILATSTQDNSLNQDLGAVPKLTKAMESQTWSVLGGLSGGITSTGVIPEPSTSLLAMIASAALLLRRKRND